MIKKYIKASFVLLPALMVVVLFNSMELYPEIVTLDDLGIEKEKETEESKERENKGREEYFFNLMRDAKTNSIPENIREKELAHALELPTMDDTRFKANSTFGWKEIGPNDVGGRTRALAVDVTDSDVIIAGGVSGGIWKSTDGGASWSLRTRTDQIPHVNSVAQDPRSGFTNTWYYTTGEPSGNSASARGGGAFYNGRGIYKSTDNGDTWNIIPSTDTGSLDSFDSCFDFHQKIQVNPITGTVYSASFACGIYRSTDGSNFTQILGATNEHEWSDIDIHANGTIVAVLSATGFTGTQNLAPGVYVSEDDGITWTDITPTQMPSGHDRSRIAIAPSDPNSVYVYSQVSGQAEPALTFINRSNTFLSASRTAGIPDFGPPVGDLNLQGGYNMTIAISPTNPNLVTLGATNLYRSVNGFSSTPTLEQSWVGGYSTANNVSLYEANHPDQHVQFYDPANPNRLFAGHDGGISVTEDVNATPVVWTSLNNSYNVTQFYNIAISRIAGDDRIVGGTQDNGSPYFTFDLDGESTNSIDVSSGDGAYAALRNTRGFTSSQNGNLFQINYLTDGNLFSPFVGAPGGIWKRVQPAGATGQLFIHPYSVDPNVETIMYYPGGANLFRNNNLDLIPDFNGGDTPLGWDNLVDFDADGNPLTTFTNMFISALDVSTSSPDNRVYVGASSFSGDAPVITRIDNANVGTGAGTNVSIPGTLPNEYVHDIVVNPNDGDEVLVIISNYNAESIYHTTNGGASWSSIEGNLATVSPLQEGPSVRSGAIADLNDGTTVFFVGTSTGLYSTTLANGASTVWVRESPDDIGFSVIESLDYRAADNTLAVGTHGRGMFIGQPGLVNPIDEDVISEVPTAFNLDQNYPNPFNPSTNIQFSIPSSSVVTLAVYDINGRLVESLINNEVRPSGTFEVNFNASGLASGTYIYRLQARPSLGDAGFTETRLMTLIK